MGIHYSEIPHGQVVQTGLVGLRPLLFALGEYGYKGLTYEIVNQLGCSGRSTWYTMMQQRSGSGSVSAIIRARNWTAGHA